MPVASLHAVSAFCLALGSADLSAAELQWEGGVTAVYQDADDSRADDELSASADLYLTLPRQGGQWQLRIEAGSSPKHDGVSAHYPTANGDARSVLTAGNDGTVQLSELHYTVDFTSGQSLMLGLVDPSGWLERSLIADDENNDFINGSFVHNPTIEFPDYTIGGIFRQPGAGLRPEVTVVLTGSDGIADTPDRSYQDLLDVNAAGRGVFAGADATWTRKQWSYQVGVWLRSDDHPVGSGDSRTAGNRGAFGIVGWQPGPHRMNLRIGFADTDVSIIDRYIALAWQRDMRLGVLGASVAHSQVSGAFTGVDGKRAFDSEIFWRIPLRGNRAHLTPALQYIEVPGIDGSEPVRSSSAIVAGLRFRWAF